MTDQSPLPPCALRPKLLIRAARLGLEDYARERDLPRVLRRIDPGGAGPVLARLQAGEARLEARRLTGDVTYSAALHVEAMIAVMAEMRLSRPDGPVDQAKASGSESLRERMKAFSASSMPGSSAGWT